jgi:hypothetical protein
MYILALDRDDAAQNDAALPGWTTRSGTREMA